MNHPELTLREWREAKNLSQLEAAQQLDPPATQGAWASWEIGVKRPSAWNAFAIERLTDGAIGASAWARIRKPQSASSRAAQKRRRRAKAA